MNEVNQTELEQAENEIEISIGAAKEFVEKKEMMDRLIRNDDFDKLFTTGYFEKEPARLVSLLSDPEYQTEEKQESLMDDMRAISGLRQYIMNIRALGRQMERQIASSESTLEEMRSELGA